MEELSLRVADWARTTLAAHEIVFGPPTDRKTGRGLSVFLLDVRPSPPARDGRPPLQAAVRYLLTPWTERPEDLFASLEQLVFAALEQHEFEVEPEPPPLALWSAFGLAPRPAILVRGLARRERSWPQAPLVKFPLAADVRPPRLLMGLVLTADGKPVADARVIADALDVTTGTDERGRFRLSIPTAGSPLRLRVRAAGYRAATIDVDAALTTETLLIRLPASEG